MTNSHQGMRLLWCASLVDEESTRSYREEQSEKKRGVESLKGRFLVKESCWLVSWSLVFRVRFYNNWKKIKQKPSSLLICRNCLLPIGNNTSLYYRFLCATGLWEVQPVHVLLRTSFVEAVLENSLSCVFLSFNRATFQSKDGDEGFAGFQDDENWVEDWVVLGGSWLLLSVVLLFIRSLYEARSILGPMRIDRCLLFPLPCALKVKINPGNKTRVVFLLYLYLHSA